MRIEMVSDDWSSQVNDPNGYPAMGGANFYRLSMVAKKLVEHGHSVTVGRGVIMPDGTVRAANWNTGAAPDVKPDIVVCQRLMGSDVYRATQVNQASGIPVLNEVDDWFVGIPTDNQAFAGCHPKANPNANRNIYDKTLGLSDSITVSTPFLQREYGKRTGVPTYLLPNQLDFDMWPAPNLIEKHLTHTTTYGWVGATPWRQTDLKVLGGVLGPFLKNTGNCFHHSGSLLNAVKPADLIGIPDEVEQSEQPMEVISKYPSLFDAIQVMVIPLTSNPFNEAKSALKGLESAAAGVPFIATPTESYRFLHDEYGIGRLAKKPKDWLRHLRDLQDPEVRIAEAAHNREQVKAHFDIGENWYRWEAVYEQTLERFHSN